MQKLSEMKKAWDSTFEVYCMREIQPEVPISGFWRCIQYYSIYGGVTNNQSELNRYVRKFFFF